MDATASTRRPSMWYSSSQYRALETGSSAPRLRPKLKISVPQSGARPGGGRVLVEGRAVEADQPVHVLGEVARHPVEDHPDTGLVALVDESTEIVRAAEAAVGAK